MTKTRTPIVLDSNQVLPLPSFQAKFYKINQSGNQATLFKVYGTDYVWGEIPFHDPSARADIIQREVRCLNRLASQLEASIVKVIIGSDVKNGNLTSAIAMKLIADDAFLDHQLKTAQTIKPFFWEAVAQRVVQFHANRQLCPPAGISYFVFIKNLLKSEIKTLINNFPAQAQKYRTWGQQIQKILQNSQDVLTQYGQIFREPIIGHGDIKTNNIANIDGQVNIIDPAPIKKWQINCQRMDAAFLKVDLELNGLAAAAARYWQAYDQLWRQAHHEILVPAYDQMIEVVDRFIELYRLLIFYRLSKKENPLKNEKCETKIEALIN